MGKCAPATCSDDGCSGKEIFECRKDGGGYDVRLDAFKGKKVKSLFCFVTVDSFGNGEMEFLINGVRLTQTCT